MPQSEWQKPEVISVRTLGFLFMDHLHGSSPKITPIPSCVPYNFPRHINRRRNQTGVKEDHESHSSEASGRTGSYATGGFARPATEKSRSARQDCRRGR